MFINSDNRVVTLTYLSVNKYVPKHDLDKSLQIKCLYISYSLCSIRLRRAVNLKTPNSVFNENMYA